ncbi:hypothetical protein [Shinella sp.]|uniref:hypothetical protein n=1 Tax=Shinella sp. TaxID=1870904 RepID=UPI003F700918
MTIIVVDRSTSNDAIENQIEAQPVSLFSSKRTPTPGKQYLYRTWARATPAS